MFNLKTVFQTYTIEFKIQLICYLMVGVENKSGFIFITCFVKCDSIYHKRISVD